MFDKVKCFGRSVKQKMDDKIQACAEALSCTQNRVVTGIIVIGFGVGLTVVGASLVLSAYVPMPT